MPTHTKCCGCCCSLNVGVIVGCSLFTLLYLIGIAAAGLRSGPDHKQAELFCTDLSADYRAAYDDCWGSDICDCGGDSCDFEKILMDSQAGGSMGLAFSLVAIIAFVTTLIGAAMRTEPLIKVMWKVLAVFPLLFFLSTCVGAAFVEDGLHVTTAVDYYDRAAREKICVDGTGADALTTDDWDGQFGVDCSDRDAIGAPELDSELDRRGPFGGGACDKDASVAGFTAFSFIFTLIFNVGLLGYLAFHVYSLHRELLSGGPANYNAGSSTGTQMQQQPPVAMAVGVAVATPAVAVATVAVAVATPAVAVATPAMAVATPAMAVATPAMAVATPAIAVAMPA